VNIIEKMMGKKKKEVNTAVYQFFGGQKRKKHDPAEIQMRLTMVMVNEAARCLEEGILQSPRDGDVGAIFGLGFPPFLGGPFRYLDRLSPQEALKTLEMLEKAHGVRFQPANIIREKAQSNQSFYAD
jgi:3-hydroxyacyl-CoA dehydrogenase/enoyl-CoA hydratase/3-hydroxybutyryl-CoA epimerase